MKTSFCLITLNEEENLPRCLRSCAGFADEIVVLDSGSTDGTERIAREFGARFIHQDWLGYVGQKNNVLSLAQNEWVFSLDADEELSPALREKVVHHFQFLWENRTEHFGNARLVRNSFETVISAQANRLANGDKVDALALTRLEADDLVTPSDVAREKYRASGKLYVVNCDACGEAYSWAPEMDLRDAVCTKCGKTYDAEFGKFAP